MQLKLQQTGEGAGERPAPSNWAHSAKRAHPYRRASRGIKMAATPLDSLCERPVTYPGDIKTLIKSSKVCICSNNFKTTVQSQFVSSRSKQKLQRPTAQSIQNVPQVKVTTSGEFPYVKIY
jgi:hypothetical protein